MDDKPQNDTGCFAVDATATGSVPDAFADAAERYREIESAIAELETGGEAPEKTMRLKAGAILSLLPPGYVADLNPGPAGEELVSVVVDNLLEQLGRGRVTVPVDELVHGMPLVGVSPDAYADHETLVEIPLSLIVRSMDPAILASRIAPAPAVDVAESLPDPFGQPGAERRRVELNDKRYAPVDSPASEPQSGLVASAQPELTEPPSVARLGGVNINHASREQLLTLNGVSAHLADAILQYRASHGPFSDIFALYHVPGLGRVRFKQITGMPYSERRHHRVRKLVKLLDMPVEAIHQLPEIARRTARLTGMQGCVISDEDGLVIAQHGIPERAGAIAAVAPRILEQAQQSMTEVHGTNLSSASICMADVLYTMARRNKICLTVVHSRRRLSKRQLGLIERLAAELSWLLSHRAYVVTDDSSAALSGVGA